MDIVPTTDLKIETITASNGQDQVLAVRDNNILHSDVGDLSSASFRQAFRTALCEKCPGLDEADVDETLMKLNQAYVVGKNNGTSTNSDRPRRRPRVDSPEPFPVDALPTKIKGFVTAASTAIGCAPEFVVLPVLSTVSAAIGNSRRIEVKAGWLEPAILWTVIVGDSGTQKTPAFNAATKPLKDIQGERWAEHEQAMKVFAQEEMAYKAALDDWKKAKDRAALPPEAPEEPKPNRITVSDVTVEALATILADNPRGLMLDRDELAGWIGSFDRYASRGGADAAHWLSIYNGSSFQVDRKTGKRTAIYVASPALSICGGIQPGILARSLGSEHFENGLAARLLMAMPARKPKKWTDACITNDVAAEYRLIIDNLLNLHMKVDENDNPSPILAVMTPGAKARWTNFYNEHAEEMADLTGPLAAAWSKLEATVARMALVLHLAKWAEDTEATDPNVVGEDSVEAAIKIVSWFKGETRRVYAAMGETEDDRQLRALRELIAKQGGQITVRDLNRGPSHYRGNDGKLAAEEDLNRLVEEGFGKWVYIQPDEHGGRPTKVFRLTTEGKAGEPNTVVASGKSACTDEPVKALVEEPVIDGVDASEADESTAPADDDGWEEVE